MPAGKRTQSKVNGAKRKQAQVVARAARMSREDLLVYELARVEEDIVGARDVQSYTALVALRKHKSQLHAELIALRLAEAAKRAEVLDADGVIRELHQVIAELPMDMLAEIEGAIKKRRGLRVVK